MHETLTDEERALYDQVVASILAEQPDNGDPEGQAERAAERALAAVHARRKIIISK